MNDLKTEVENMWAPVGKFALVSDSVCHAVIVNKAGVRTISKVIYKRGVFYRFSDGTLDPLNDGEMVTHWIEEIELLMPEEANFAKIGSDFYADHYYAISQLFGDILDSATKGDLRIMKLRLEAALDDLKDICRV